MLGTRADAHNRPSEYGIHDGTGVLFLVGGTGLGTKRALHGFAAGNGQTPRTSWPARKAIADGVQ
ncbi:hypothetical protein PG988_004451 [Apiospora saccharicola]